MTIFKKEAYCPVGNHIKLGELTKGEICSFVCKECRFMFSWDREGKLLPPIKIAPPPKLCMCASCIDRNSRSH